MTIATLRCDGTDYANLANLYAAAGRRAPLAVKRAVSRKGRKALVHVARAMAEQLKIGPRRIRRYVKGGMPNANTYVIMAKGKIPLRYFQTRQTPGGVTVEGVPKDWIDGAENLAIAFQGKTGAPGNQPGNAAKRRGTLGGAIIYGTGKRRREGLRIVHGVSVPRAFLDHATMGEFLKVAAELPAELMHQLWVVVEGLDQRAKSARVARGGYLRRRLVAPRSAP
jgi:hypothetical protein